MKNNSKYTAVCDLPSLAPEGLKALREHIRQHGVLDDIHVDEQGRIIDGLFRKQIAEDLGIPCPEKVHQGLSEEEKRALRRALNLARRHLTNEQKRELIAAQLRDTPHWANRRIGTALGVSHPTVIEVRREMEATGKITTPEATVGRDGKARPVSKPLDLGHSGEVAGRSTDAGSEGQGTAKDADDSPDEDKEPHDTDREIRQRLIDLAAEYGVVVREDSNDPYEDLMTFLTFFISEQKVRETIRFTLTDADD